MLIHNEVFKNLSIDKNFFWADDRTNMICIDCGKEFNQHGHMKVHIALVHYQLQNKDNSDTLSKSDVEIETLDCDEKKRSKSMYTKDNKEVAGTHNILIEGSPTSTTDGILNAVENEDKQNVDKKKTTPAQCMECGKSYYCKKGLRRHALVHTGERPFPCNKCDKKFRQKPTLNKHKKMHAKPKETTH